ncbi:MAG: enoyl-CoA hydratase-related protein [Thermoanaerobaculia bacterium]|nr:enoyl-CoA hydratase-related protein [Thermoanaerobaculia bacterium]
MPSIEPGNICPESFRYAFDARSGVATITLDRADRYNALTFQVYDELKQVFDALDTEPGVRAVVLTGAGKAFCSGGDVEDIIGELFERDYRGLLDFTRRTGALIVSMIRCRRPIVGALNGLVAGASAVIAAACDVRIASEDAKIAYLFTKVGLSGADMGASWLLPRIVGHGRATELLMFGDFVDATTAQTWGLYNRVVPKEDVLDTACSWAERLAAGPSFGLEVTKNMLYRGLDGHGAGHGCRGRDSGGLHGGSELPRVLRRVDRETKTAFRLRPHTVTSRTI